MTTKLDDLVTKENGLKTTNQKLVTQGDGAKTDLARYTQIVDQITAVQKQRDDAKAAAQAQLTATKAKAAATESSAALTALETSLKLKLKTPGEVDGLLATDPIKGTLMSAPLDPTKSWDFYRKAKSDADAAVPGADLAAKIARINAAAKLQIVGAQLEALLGGVAQLASCTASADTQLGATRDALSRGDVGGAYAALYRGLRSLATVDAAAATIDATGLSGAGDDYGDARDLSITADDTLRAALDAQGTAANNLTTANAQLAQALNAKAK